MIEDHVNWLYPTILAGGVIAVNGLNKVAYGNNETLMNATHNVTQAQIPGFEGIFAVTGLAAIAYLILGRKRRAESCYTDPWED